MATALLISCAVLTGCGSKAVHHHKAAHSRTTAVKKACPKHAKKSSNKLKKSTKVNSKNIDKSGLSNSDIKKDAKAVHQKSSSQPVD